MIKHYSFLKSFLKSFLLLIISGVVFIPFSKAQEINPIVERNLVTPLFKVFNPSDLPEASLPVIEAPMDFKAPKHYDIDLKKALDQRKFNKSGLYRKNYVNPTPGSEMIPSNEKGFEGASTGNVGIPNDNNVAVSDNGYVISVLNSTIRIYNDTGKFLKSWSLYQLTRPPHTWPDGTTSIGGYTYDPKVMYDQETQRFIIVFLYESKATASLILAGFSSTSNPLDPWYIYKFSGNPLNNKLWTDYPMLGLTKSDLFITGNLLLDSNLNWRTAFVESVIWQINKSDGYAGKPMHQELWHNLKFKNKSIWNICPVNGSNSLPDNEIHFLSVRPSDASNDTVFLHKIIGSQASGNATYSHRVITTDKKYGLPPTAQQPSNKFRLQTNDARVLGGFIHQNKIQYVQTTLEPTKINSAIYHGIIHNLTGNPVIKGNIISVDTLDYAYPTIAWAGDKDYDQSALITFSHCGPKTFPGTSAVYVDRYSEYSGVTMIKKGTGNIIINGNPDTNQRWGDYTAIQKVYGKKNQFYLVGSFGKNISGNTNEMATWVARISVTDGKLVSSPFKAYGVFPNPAIDKFYFEFDAEIPGTYSIKITDLAGKQIGAIFKQYFDAGYHIYEVKSSEVRPGMYYLSVTNSEGKSVLTRKVILE